MNVRRNDHKEKALIVLIVLCFWAWTGCNITKSVPKGKHLLRSNTIKLKTNKVITRRGEIKDNLDRLIQQKPNSYAWYTFNQVPVKLLLYNLNPKKYEKDTVNYQLKSHTVERPVIYDSSQVRKTVQYMISYLLNQGYFYAKVNDTTIFKKKKAYVTYNVVTGKNYLINKVDFTSGIEDSTIKELVIETESETKLKHGTNFTYSLLESERSRIAEVMRDHGYYKFSQENISFQLDTANKEYFRNADNPFESAINFIATQKAPKNPTCNIKVFIKKEGEPDAFKQYTISKVSIFPDFINYHDFRDSSMIVKDVEGTIFKYHNYFVHSNVLFKHTFIKPGSIYRQSDYDRTITQLSDLGIFQYIRIVYRPDTAGGKNMITCRIEMNKNPKHSLSTNFEVSNGTTYSVGTSLTETYRDINLMKGANMLTITTNGGIELAPFTQQQGENFFNHYPLQTKYYGLNASIDFPKFVAPIAAKRFASSNLPHTIISGGTNLMERVNYFTLVNTNVNFSYNWRETQTKTWDFSPAFVNIIHLPYESDSFKARLDTNTFLRNSYRENFIEGENLSYTFANQGVKAGKSYSYVKVGLEEAGAVLSGINGLGIALNDKNNIQYAQYVKFDFDARHYFKFQHSTVAVRFDGGVGVPYDQSTALPYVKQYYVGGPYSLRGWRVRSLGPGSSLDSTTSNLNYIDRTGDIKLEFSGEYRFDIAQLFAGFIKMNGAVFTDAGNIWLYNKDKAYPGGEFKFSTLWQDVAADVGAGLRFDIADIIPLRFDLAFPIKKPYVLTNNGWVVNEVALGDPDWRYNNLVFSIALNYPF